MNVKKFARLAVLFLVMTVLPVVAQIAPPSAAAEIGSTQGSYWGVATKGNSNTVAGWEGLGWAVDQIGDTVFVGGNFLDVTNGTTTERQPHLAAFDAEDGRWRSWFRPDVGNAVFALEPSPDGALFVGGEIDTWGGNTVGALMKIDPATGAPWPGWTTRVYGGTSVVRDLKIEDDGLLYVVGSFTTAGYNGSPQQAKGAIRVDPVTGAIDSSWKPWVDGTVWGVSRSKTRDRVYLAGHFDSVNGQGNTEGFVAVDDNGGVVVNRDPAVPLNNCSDRSYCWEMNDVEATEFGTVFVGGVEHSLYVLDEDTMTMDLHHYTACDPNFTDCNGANWVGGEYQEIKRVGNRIYATCHCWTFHWTDTTLIQHKDPHGPRTEIDSIAAYDPASGQRIQSFRPYLNGKTGGWGIHGNPTDGCLWVAGGFYNVGPNNENPGRDLVRLCDDAGAGPAATPDNPPPPVPSCSVAVVGGQATVTWAAMEGADSYVVRRATDGGNANWRARVYGVSYTEQPPAGATHRYQVVVRYEASQLSPPTICTPDVGGGGGGPVLTATPWCTTTVSGSTVNVTWGDVAAADDYVVERSVDGSPSYWRGRVDAPSLAFADSLRTDVTLVYRVVARDAVGTRAPFKTCSPSIFVAGGGGAPFGSPASCSATINGGNATISWPAVNGASRYIIYRNVDGGTAFWRGTTNAPGTTFTDTLRPGTHTYRVIAVDTNGIWSNPWTTCPNITVGNGGAPFGSPASCSATINGGNATISWPAVNGASRYIIYRNVDGGTAFWRGTTNAPGTTFTDTLRPGTHTYRVIAVDTNGIWSNPWTTCPNITF